MTIEKGEGTRADTFSQLPCFLCSANFASAPAEFVSFSCAPHSNAVSFLVSFIFHRQFYVSLILSSRTTRQLETLASQNRLQRQVASRDHALTLTLTVAVAVADVFVWSRNLGEKTLPPML